MNSTALNCTSLVTQFNADIAGRGVRISFYLQSLVLVLLVKRSNEDAENGLWTLIATSFGLTVAAWAQLAQVQIEQKLTLLQGILVSQLTWLAVFGMNLGLASYTDAGGTDGVVKIATVLQTYFSMISTLVMWINAEHLTPVAACIPATREQIKLIIMFGLPLQALGSGRRAALGFSGLFLAFYTILTVYDVYGWIKNWKKKKNTRTRRTSRPAERMRRRRGSGSGGAPMEEAQLRHRFGLERFQNFTQRLWPGGVEPVFLAILILQTLITVYFVATTELVIVKNGEGHDDMVSGFGQILALIVAIPSLLALYRAVRERFSARSLGGRKTVVPSEHTHNTVLTDMPVVPDTAVSPV